MIRIDIDETTRYARKGVSDWVGLILVSLRKQRYLSPAPRKGAGVDHLAHVYKLLRDGHLPKSKSFRVCIDDGCWEVFSSASGTPTKYGDHEDPVPTFPIKEAAQARLLV